MHTDTTPLSHKTDKHTHVTYMHTRVHTHTHTHSTPTQSEREGAWERERGDTNTQHAHPWPLYLLVSSPLNNHRFIPGSSQRDYGMLSFGVIPTALSIISVHITSLNSRSFAITLSRYHSILFSLISWQYLVLFKVHPRSRRALLIVDNDASVEG